MRKVIAIDFDGCLCEYAWPEIGAPHMEVINAALQEREKGVALILWTCRAGKRLDKAVNWCERYGLKFDAVNENLPGIITDFKVDTRKVFADEYWDDRAVHMPIPPNEPLTLDELREMDGEPVWCVDGRGNQCWCLVNCDDGLPCCYDNETGLWEDCFYGMTGDGRFGLHQSGWLAYRSKPEEGTNAVT